MARRMALWSVSNVLLITTLRDGQCLPPLEFIAVKKHNDSTGTVILSEFSGCNRALGGILKINPFNTEEIAKTIQHALGLTKEDKLSRLQIAYKYIKKHSTENWARTFLQDMKRAHNPIKDKNGVEVLGLQDDTTFFITHGVTELNTSKLEKAYRIASNRLIILYQDGEPSEQFFSALQALSRDNCNQIYIYSSHSKEEMNDLYAERLPRVGLVAEEGFYFKRPFFEEF